MTEFMETRGKHRPEYQKQVFFERRTRYCVLVVVFNEGERIRSQLERMRARSVLADIIVADGYSTDGSTDPDYLRGQGVRALLATREEGLSTAIRMGFAYAMDEGYEGVITVDGNGKDGIEDIEKFIEALGEGYDLVQGSRFLPGGVHENTPLDRLLAIRWVVAPLLSCGGFRYTDPTNGFRALSGKFLRDARVQPVRGVFVRFNLQLYIIYRAAQLKFSIKEVPVRRVYPRHGATPTKITRWRTKALFFWELFSTVLGRYAP